MSEAHDAPRSRAECERLDAQDSLAPLRELFLVPDAPYLDGNSLGLLPRAVSDRVHAAVAEEWGTGLIGSWNEAGWIHLPGRVGRKIARLVGAGAADVLVADSTSVNLFKVLNAALSMRPKRRVILTETGNFPSDLYVMQGVADFLGGEYEVRRIDGESVVDAIDQEVAVVCLTHVNYRSGRMHDMAAVTAAAHAAGALMIWDLAHSTGAVPLELAADDVDFAVGCSYKFLNGGPGAPGFLYVAPKLQSAARQPLQGWLGHAEPFAFHPDYRPAPGVERHQCGTPPVLSLTALDAALEVFDGVSMDAVRAKSVALAALVIARFDAELAARGFSLETPREAALRGSQVSLSHPEAYAICQALIRRGVVGDYREPNILRLGLTPLYQRHVDIWDAMEALVAVMCERAWDDEACRKRAYVT